MTLQELKKLKMVAFKHKQHKTKNALTSVISACETEMGRGNFDDSRIVDIVKKTIKIYKEEQEATGKDNYEEIKYLKSLLPQPLSEAEIVTILSKESFKSPKQAMEHLDELGHSGRYDKGFVARTVLNK